MTIRQQGGVFGRSPTFNNVTIDGTLSGLSNLSLSGNLVLANGQGIDFSATSGTGTSELFDDYEEGTWTPVPQDSSGNSGTAATASGYYTKVGNLVYLNFLLQDINTTGLSSGQDLRIAGQPFSSASIVGAQFYLGSVRMVNVAFSGHLSLGILDSTDYIRVVETASGAASDFIVVSEVTSGTGDIYGTIVYMAS